MTEDPNRSAHGRLIVLSNRIPTEAEPAGGLVVALHECLRKRGGIWIGSSGDPVASVNDELTSHPTEGYSRKTFDLDQHAYDNFYLGYANSILWPLFHHRSDLMQMEPAYAESYIATNRRVAGMIARELRPDDLLWVHDYHFLPIAAELRKVGVKNRIGFFLHIPFPVANDVMALPERADFNRWLTSFDLVGLQTQRDVAALLDLIRNDPDAELMLNGDIETSHGKLSVRSFPIGIDVDRFAADAAQAVPRQSLGLAEGTRLIVGADRLDYSKGLVQRFEAFRTYLDHYAPGRDRATFIQIAQPSREALDAYQDIRSALEASSGAINGQFSELDWTPIRYISRGVPRAQLAGVMRRADVCLVTPIADGMNLVAKEFIAAQDPADPGVLILSSFAGAAEQMKEALIVNPYDIEEVAKAIAQALDMPLQERKARHKKLLLGIRMADISWWSDSFLHALDTEQILSAAIA